jgi:Uma2 family endonuclease
MSKIVVKIGPSDHGKPMSLDDFDRAEVQEGYRYELGRGVIVVSDLPGRRHRAQWKEIHRQVSVYQVTFPDVIDTLATGDVCKILVPPLDSERHPDLLIYKTSEDDIEEEAVWRTWIPEVVVEIVSLGSELRDYVEKREEYLRFGIKEYWIVDAERQEVLVLRRWRNRWRERVVSASETDSTRLLPGFVLDVGRIFAAANRVRS